MRDWVAWHDAYDDPASSLSARLTRVSQHLSDAIDSAPPGQVRVLSLCAGQGHDVLGVLPGHPRRDDVSAVLVEVDERNVALARRRAEAAGLAGVEVRQCDAADVTGFADALPADVLLLCGIFGNIGDAQIERTVAATPLLCTDGATVIWTRHRRPPDLTPRLRGWFASNGFGEVAFDALGTENLIGLGAHRLRTRPAGTAELPARPLFTFRDD